MFPTRVRLTGMAIGTQVGFAIGGFAPTVAGMIVGTGPAGWVPVAALALGMTALAAIAILTAHETCNTPLWQVDGMKPTHDATPPLPEPVRRKSPVTVLRDPPEGLDRLALKP